MIQTIILWAFAACGVLILWSAMSAANLMMPGQHCPLDRMGWVATGVAGLWAALQPFSDQPVTLEPMQLVMAASLAVLSRRMIHDPQRRTCRSSEAV